MSIELKIPEVGESVREVQIGRWLKQEGDAVALDENVVELETDKALADGTRRSRCPGVLGKVLKKEGDMVAVGEVIAYVEEQGSAGDKKPEPARAESNTTTPPAAPAKKPAEQVVESCPEKQTDEIVVSPAARPRPFANTASTPPISRLAAPRCERMTSSDISTRKKPKRTSQRRSTERQPPQSASSPPSPPTASSKKSSR